MSDIDRRAVLAGLAGSLAMAAGIKAAEPQVVGWTGELIAPKAFQIREWTMVRMVTDDPYPFTRVGIVSHLPDLSDLAEPYLSAVIEARKPEGVNSAADRMLRDYSNDATRYWGMGMDKA